MRKSEGRLAGILGTVIFHLIAAIIFMSFQIKSVNRDEVELFSVELQEVEAIDMEELIKLPAKTTEKIQQEEDEMLNIIRNLSSNKVQTIDPSDYIDQVKEELIKSGQLGKDNYIDEQKRQALKNGEEELAVKEDKTTEPEKPSKSQEMAANYKGPTRIYYDLEGRTHTYLPIPIYKCMGSGKVVLAIEVNQKGVVEDARVLTEESTATDQCLIETALNTALVSRFNSDVNSPKTQKGTIAYHFVAQ